jgi:hypothetical protein
MHIIWIRVYTSVYVYAGVLNYETVYHMSSLFGIWYMYYEIIKRFHGYVGLSDDDWSILILVSVWQMNDVFD